MIRELLIGCGLALAVGGLCLRKRALTWDGVALAAGLMIALAVLGGWRWTVCLIFAFFVIAAADKVVGHIRPRQEHEPRTARQVAENGLPALLAAVGFRVFPGLGAGFLAAFCAALGQALCDSLSSDVGVLSRRAPVDLVRWKPVEPGSSGGVSLLGTLTGLGGSVLCVGFCCLLLGLSPLRGLAVAGTAFAGTLLDSLLGSTLQARFRCAVCGKLTEKRRHCGAPARHESGWARLDNGAVNLVCNGLTAAAAVLLFR